MTTNNLPETLDACHELIRRLQEENVHLRAAGAVFGQLAERLNHELRAERSLYADAPLHGANTDPCLEARSTHS